VFKYEVFDIKPITTSRSMYESAFESNEYSMLLCWMSNYSTMISLGANRGPDL